eukprot:Phypoly_transcript_03869.p1 GENE.Phypoly_transcript_03869~~Phypoly_transcript_03869.p1  ORF type:complete len:754 (+),score=92.90 Phypoly_transcript_03869:56-2317(+)
MEQWHTGQSGVAFIFYTLMKDPQAIAIFKDFLKVHGHLNALNFVLDVFKFRSSSSPPNSLESRNAAVDIYTKYLVTQAPNLVPIPPHLKLEIDSVISTPDTPLPSTLFDKASSDVAEKLQEDDFKRFIRTPQYEAYQLSKEARNDVGVMLCKLPGEALVHKPLRVLFWNPFIKSFVQCGLYITNFRLTFGNFSNPAKATDLELLDEISSVPLGCISKITRAQQRPPQLETMEVHCKDFRKIEFQLDASPSTSFPSPSTQILKRTIKSLCFPRATTDLFAFFFKPTWNDRKDWQRYNIIEEFMRQGISFENWRFTDINHDYSMCNSYPSRFVVPTSIMDEQLISVFAYRSRGRIPILCWSHPITGASISRSSQPNSGVLRTRSPEDEALLKAIGETGGNTRTLYLLDARPRANALGNTVKGKGFENVGSYSNCKIEFLGIANIHAMRESLQKVESLCLSGNEDQWYSVLDSAKWFDHIRDIFAGTMRTVELVEEGYPVLLHCSDGWDRTAQLSSLSMLLLDSYYRTINGFIVLIEKEWLACGHRFLSRVGHGIKNPSDQNRSPVFLQFLDCVYQITLQFGCSFEFNENFLITIAQHLYTCQFGTFLFDSDQERQQYQVAAKTTSIWSYIRAHHHEFENPFYMPDSNVLKLDVHMDKFVFWSKLYLMWVRQKSSTNIVTTEMRGMMLKSMNDQMAKRIKELEKELQQKEAQVPKGEVQHDEEEKSQNEVEIQSEIPLQEESPKKEVIPLLDDTAE